jgi:hypothetical protein
MSLPESEKELLLSASIDGTLSPEEQEVLDRWLREDPAAVKRRDELASLVSSVRDTFRNLRHDTQSHQRLGSDFAESVVEMAIAQAVENKLPPSHPLMRIGQSDRVMLPAGGTDARDRRRLAIVAIVAAAMLGGVFVATLGNIGDDRRGTVALLGQPIDQPVDVENDPAIADPSALGVLSPDSNNIAPNASVPSAEMVAEALGQPISAGEPLQQRDPSSVVLDKSAASDIGQLVPKVNVGEKANPAESMGSRDVATAKQTESSQAPPAQLAAVMVVSIELTEHGQESLALLAALRSANIRLGNQGVLSDQVVKELRESAVVQTPQNDRTAKLYFVEAPARQIDQFLMQVLADKQSFASIGLGISDSKPLLTSIGGWRPTEAELEASRNPVGQELAADLGRKAMARDLVADDGKPLRIDRGTAMLTMDRDMGTAGFMMAAPPSPSNVSGTPAPANNFSAPLILLVH